MQDMQVTGSENNDQDFVEVAEYSNVSFVRRTVLHSKFDA